MCQGKATLKSLGAVLVLAVADLLVSCGGSGSGPAPPCTNCTPSSDFVYQANANQVSIFEVDSNSGTVLATPNPVASAQIPGGIVATSNHFLYVTEYANLGGVVYGYAVNTSTGELSALTGSPFNTGVQQPAQGMAVDPAGKFLYVTEPNTNEVVVLAIAADGSLTPITGSPFETNDVHPTAASMDASGSYLYVSNLDSPQGGVSAFSIDMSSGALTAISGSPFATMANGGPGQLATDPVGKYLYVPMSTGAAVVAFAQDSSGALVPLSGSPFAVGSQPNSVAVDPTGKLLFSADFAGNDVSILSIDAGGALTPVPGSPVAVANNPYQVAVNASGTLLFVSCAGSLSIVTFTVSSSGALTPVAPLNGGPTSAGVAIVHQSS
jgi:6-phosphogluconolactonase (cycloisomerase 2 family)